MITRKDAIGILQKTNLSLVKESKRLKRELKEADSVIKQMVKNAEVENTQLKVKVKNIMKQTSKVLSREKGR